MVPEGWGIKKVEDVLERVVDPVNVDPNIYYEQIGIRSHGKGIFYKEAVSGKQLGNKRVFWIKPNCFIVNIVFAWEQAIAKTTDHEVGKIASHRFPMYQPKPGQADIDYLVHFFKTSRGKYLLELASPGGAGRNKTLGQKEFANLMFPMPTGLEQKKIARILSTWDKAIETVEKLIENSQAQKKALMQQLLTGKRRLPGFDGEWEEARLKQICSIKKGAQLNRDTLDKTGRYPVINGGIEPSGYTHHYNTEKDTITISEGGNSCGFVSFKEKEFWCGGHCYALTSVKVNNLYLYHFLKFIERNIMRLRVGSGLPNIQKKAVESIYIHIPSSDEQQKIASVLTTADKEIQTLQQKLDCLKQEKKALMQQLLTGKRRVEVSADG